MDFKKCILFNKILSEINPANDINKNLKVDTFHLAYIEFSDNFELPGIPIDGPQESEIKKIINILQKKIPEFINDTHILPQTRPLKDSQQLHFVKEYEIESKKYLYILKIFTVYMGGAKKDEILEKATQAHSPTFRTNRIYFQARLLPIQNITYQGNWIVDFEANKLKNTLFKTSGANTKRDKWSTAFFDEMDFTELNNDLLTYFLGDSHWEPGRVFSPVIIDYLTLSMNLIYPDTRILKELVTHFHEGYSSFLENMGGLSVPEKTKNYLSSYFSQFTKKLSLAKSGNPHWEIQTYPDYKWHESLKKTNV